eukprot:CAMPEP_0172645574 /NCGR_PEP_ID=MMETSP1068-20121228/239800_1 /TAXON_ID=35684 /ORGANISM="Pseudopedinella elastica, Strain CCMP716" /LENGTH=297 /DNA_ID=CAMNT_0013459811 /DNA_START=150 /DNA_END=1043 /DNA_ORIENTATION=+
MTAHSAEIIFASCCAEVVQKSVLHPIDSLKTRMQYNAKKRPSGGGVVLGDLKDAWRIVQMEKQPVRSLYRGLVPSVVGSVPTAIVYMPTYEASKAMLSGTCLAPLAGVVTGCVSACVRVPTSVVKSRLQLKLHDNSAAVVRSILKNEGPLGLFAGFRATVALDVFYAVIQFAVLERLRQVFALLVLGSAGGNPSELGPAWNAAIGFLTGAVTAAATEPVDVVRTRLMAQVKGGASKGGGIAFGYTGVVDGIYQVAKSEGVGSLWKGLLPRLILKSLGSSVWYAVYMGARGVFQQAFI